MTLDKHEAKVVREAAARAATPGPWEDALDTPEQVLRYLDTVMHSDDQAMRLGAYNRVALYVKQSATLRSTIEGLTAEREQLTRMRDMLAVMGADFADEVLGGSGATPEDWLAEAQRRLMKLDALFAAPDEGSEG